MKKKYSKSLLSVLFAVIAFLQIQSSYAQWNSNTAENTLISGLGVSDMQTVATPDGKMWVAFFSLNAGNYDMYAQLFDADGNKLLGPDGMLVSNQTSGSATYVFNVCLDASNNLIIGTQDNRSGELQSVLYKISQSGNHLWSPSGVILGAGLSPYQAVLTTGEVISAFNASTGSTLNLQKVKTDGTLAWAVPKAVLVGTTKTTRGQIVAAPDGKFTMVYQKKGYGVSSTLWVQKFDSAGTALYGPLQISTLTASSARYYSILANADTTYFGYYVAQGSRFNSYLQRINPDGTIPWGNNGSNFNTSVTSTDPYQGLTNISFSPGSPYVWSVCTFSNSSQSNYGVYIQKFLLTTGARQFGDGAKVVFPISSGRDQQAGGLVLVDDTPMFMEYDLDYKIYATRLDANGDFAWPVNRVEISSTTALMANPKGRFGFTAAGVNKCAGYWYEDRSTGLGKLGYAQGISKNGLVGIKVATFDNVPAIISTMGGTLQIIDTIFPLTANQDALWSIVPVTGAASVSGTGLVTALSDGTVWVKGTAVQDNTMMDSLLITITGQTPPECNAPTGIAVSHITSDSAFFRWISAIPLPTAGYEYELRTSGTPGSGPSGLTTSGTTLPGVDSVLIGGLTGGTQYYFYLRSNCGDGNYSPWTSAVTFTTVPVTIVVAGSVNESQSSCYNASGTITVAGNGTTFVIHNGGSTTMIAGMNILFLPGTTIEPGGYLHGYITQTNEYCNNPTNMMANNVLNSGENKSTALEPYTEDQHVIVYPNPTKGAFTLEVKSNSTLVFTHAAIYNITGMRVFTAALDGSMKYNFSLEELRPGVYFLHISGGEKREMIKIVKLSH